ncbi:hypothetical protein ANANG_G00106670, partial [Anguilla anguilla]
IYTRTLTFDSSTVCKLDSREKSRSFEIKQNSREILRQLTKYTKMESPPDPASDPGNSASEPATPVRDTPVNLETLRKADQQAPVRRQTCSSTNRAV